MTTVLGIDPGSRVTGYGLIEAVPFKPPKLIVAGTLRVANLPFPASLRAIRDGIANLFAAHAIDEVAIEEVFVSRTNPAAAIKLGQARGAALVAVPPDTPVAAYAPRQIKQAVVGYGGAEKAQVGHMVKLICGLEKAPAADAADAVAVAICHVHSVTARIAPNTRLTSASA